jgi:hypothetical protein
MRSELKARWVAALRSGEYPQGQRRLCANSLYCCLGVLAEIENIFTGESEGAKYVQRGDGIHFSVLNPVLDRLGLTYDQQNKLIHLNDGENKSFPEIADWIEEHVHTD